MNTAQAIRVAPLGLSGSGAQSETGRKLDTQNKEVTMMLAQSNADTLYDPDPAKRPTEAQMVSGFENYSASTATAIAVCGVLLFVYGIVSRN
jgi:hypothetical protein